MDLNVILSVRSWELSQAASHLELWKMAFKSVGGLHVQFCVSVSGAGQALETDLDSGAYCIHKLPLSSAVDRYKRDSLRYARWTPWGAKSGPNYQFARTLWASADTHAPTWALLIELDTIPLRAILRQDLEALFEKANSPWVIGSLPTEKVQESLSPSIKHHINGAAFYKVGDPEFLDFLDFWDSSILIASEADPNTAFDLLTSLDYVREIIPAPERSRWEGVNGKIIHSEGMINASGLGQDTILMRQSKSRNYDDKVEPSPWFLHTIEEHARPFRLQHLRDGLPAA